MTSRIPTSTSITESAVIESSLADVWHMIKLQDFQNFWTKLSKSEYVKGASQETDIVKWTFKDGTVLEVKQEEHSTIDHYITYSIISAEPAMTYSSVISTVRCFPVTSGKDEGATFKSFHLEKLALLATGATIGSTWLALVDTDAFELDIPADCRSTL
ncbi:hypothetical protein MMC25_003289 [Agyrium rufum]|nr:hypothetical protein [Agyrium rufum]